MTNNTPWPVIVDQIGDLFENKNPQSLKRLYQICNMREPVLSRLRDIDSLLNLRMGIFRARNRWYQNTSAPRQPSGKDSTCQAASGGKRPGCGLLWFLTKVTTEQDFSND